MILNLSLIYAALGSLMLGLLGYLDVAAPSASDIGWEGQGGAFYDRHRWVRVAVVALTSLTLWPWLITSLTIKVIHSIHERNQQ